jgi:hypothetical protein
MSKLALFADNYPTATVRWIALFLILPTWKVCIGLMIPLLGMARTPPFGITTQTGTAQQRWAASGMTRCWSFMNELLDVQEAELGFRYRADEAARIPALMLREDGAEWPANTSGKNSSVNRRSGRKRIPTSAGKRKD